ncbi:carbohydrate-binding module family 50 protein [Alternaria burnsii]|uniref:Carbohydrate-binding module family 50 protein n=1 Tax=Alternaria burnsii TaxID=1187904 RepID=A0A8H7B303_9PLEO|nr:carbohydrate-binding module family 50 protein [Alternaria burnsii]KAF7675422.1 carbohydrate-binding module family 50 protein [Alternaria burnsii]CAI9630464.1 unnamed protein product [Alternaria burnsii]
MSGYGSYDGSGSGYNQGGGYGQQGGYQQQGGYGQNDYNGSGGYQQPPPHQQQSHHGLASQYYGGQGGPQGYGQQGGYDAAPPQYQQLPSAAAHSSNSGRNSLNQGHQNQYGGEGDPEGDRGIMGGIAGAAAGGYGGHALGGKAGHGVAGTVIGALAGAFAGHKGQDAVEDKWDEHKEKKKEEEDRKRYEEEEERRRKYGQQHGGPPPIQHHQGSGNRSNDQRTPGDYGGNFSDSSRDIRLDAHGDYTLHAQCRRADGSYQSSSISLNRILENDGGSFRWSGSNNSGGGENTYTVQQGDTLRAIASRFSHCSYEELARHNNIANADQIWPGQNLRIPGGNSSRGGGGFGNSARNMTLRDGGQKLEGDLEHHGQWHRREINLDERISNQNGALVFI